MWHKGQRTASSKDHCGGLEPVVAYRVTSAVGAVKGIVTAELNSEDRV